MTPLAFELNSSFRLPLLNLKIITKWNDLQTTKTSHFSIPIDSNFFRSKHMIENGFLSSFSKAGDFEP